jgi:hypothetical protein
VRGMAPFRRIRYAAAATVAILLSFVFRSALPVNAQLSTKDHLAEPGWWPSQTSRSLDEYTGSSACAKCHKQKAADQRTTPMARTLMRAEDADILHAASELSFQNGKYVYKITQRAGRPELSVTDGARTISAALVWAFGTSEVAQSYLFLRDGNYFESRATYFRTLQNIHFTPARALLTPDSLEEAMARPVGMEEIERCFLCHSTAAVVAGKFEPSKLTLSVTCEACHGPGAKHTDAMQASILQGGTGDEQARAVIFDPGKLSPADSVDFCGACHGTWWDVQLAGITGVSKVRSQPYRLQSSKCWGKGDSRITCVACHDPHVPLVREASGYDEKCLKCHVSTVGSKATKEHPGAACPVATKDCATCHMPKIEVPEMHYAFADHLIRVVRPGAPFPE